MILDFLTLIEYLREKNLILFSVPQGKPDTTLGKIHFDFFVKR